MPLPDAPSTPPAARVRLMLVDDHPLVRDGLRARLQAVDGFEVVAEAADAKTALAQATRVQPDIVLMDIGLPGANGIEATRVLLEACPAARVLVLSMQDSPQTVDAALRAGAWGYLLKDCPGEEIVQAIQAVMAGQRLQAPRDIAPPAPAAGDGLTPREREVLDLIALGLSSREIGDRLSMSSRTVETHRSHLRRKLRLASAAALLRYAIEHQRGPGAGRP